MKISDGKSYAHTPEPLFQCDLVACRRHLRQYPAADDAHKPCRGCGRPTLLTGKCVCISIIISISTPLCGQCQQLLVQQQRHQQQEEETPRFRQPVSRLRSAGAAGLCPEAACCWPRRMSTAEPGGRCATADPPPWGQWPRLLSLRVSPVYPASCKLLRSR